MSKFSETVTDFLFPLNLRPYWTFRSATALAVLASVATAVCRTLVRFSPEQIARWESRYLLHSPLFLGLFYLFAAMFCCLYTPLDTGQVGMSGGCRCTA